MNFCFLRFHRNEQWDIVAGGIKKPIIVMAWITPNSYQRLLCIWNGGLWICLPNKKRLCWRLDSIERKNYMTWLIVPIVLIACCLLAVALTLLFPSGG